MNEVLTFQGDGVRFRHPSGATIIRRQNFHGSITIEILGPVVHVEQYGGRAYEISIDIEPNPSRLSAKEWRDRIVPSESTKELWMQGEIAGLTSERLRQGDPIRDYATYLLDIVDEGEQIYRIGRMEFTHRVGAAHLVNVLQRMIIDTLEFTDHKS